MKWNVERFFFFASFGGRVGVLVAIFILENKTLRWARVVLDRKTHTHTQIICLKRHSIYLFERIFFCLLFVHQMLKYICGCCVFFLFFICWTSVWQSRSVCVYSSSATYLKNIYKFYTCSKWFIFIYIHWQDNNGVYPFIHWI